MGTAAFDKVIANSKTQAQSQTSAFDRVLAKQQQQQQPTSLPVEHTGMWSTLGDYAKFMYLATDKHPQDMDWDKDSFVKAAKQVGGNFLKFFDDVGTLVNNPAAYVGQHQDEFKKMGSDLVSNPLETAKNLGSGAVLSLASIPVGIITSITGSAPGPTGQPIPATPEQAAQAIQSTIALGASGLVAGRVAKLLSPTTESLIKPVSIPGNLIKAAYPKTVVALASGATYGGVSSIGSEDQLATTVGSALAFAGTGAIFHYAGVKLLGKESWSGDRVKAVELAKTNMKSNATSLAAARFMEIGENDSPAEIAAKTKAYATSSDYISAKLDAGLTMSKRVIFDDLDAKTVDDLIGKYTPSKKLAPQYTPSPEVQATLDSKKGTVGKIDVDITDPFDKASLIAEKDPKVLEELKGLGLTDAEITSHRNYVKNKMSTGVKDKSNLTSYSDTERAQKQTEATDKGKALLESLDDGKSVLDATGKKWTRVGTTITDGQQALPIDSEITQRLIGTDLNFHPDAKVLRLPKQSFNPEYGRETNPAVSFYKGPNGETLASSYPLHPDEASFFNKTGFLRDETVSVHGQPANVTGATNKYVNIKFLAEGKETRVLAKSIKRLPEAISSDLDYTNREKLYDGMYQDFRKTFDLDKEQTEPFGKSMLRFAKQAGITNPDDIVRTGHAFFQRMLDEVVGEMPEHEQQQYAKAITTVHNWHEAIINDTGLSLHNSLMTNNMSLTSRGGGIYDIKDFKSGKIQQTVHSLEEAQEFINKSDQANGLTLDGGYSNPIPVEGMGKGAQLDGFEPTSGRLARLFDEHINAGAMSKTIAQQGAAIGSMDERGGVNPGTGEKLDFHKHFNAMQHLQVMLRNITQSDPIIKKMSDTFNKALKIDWRHKLDLNKKTQIYDKLTSIHPDDLIDHFKLDKNDQALGAKIAKVGSSPVIDFVNRYNKATDGLALDDPKRLKKLSELVQTGDSKVGDVAAAFIKTFNGNQKPAVVMKLAQMLEHGPVPEPKLNNVQSEYRDHLKAAHEAFPGVTDPFWAYLPHAKLAELVGHNPFVGHSKEFLPAYTNLSSTPAGQIELDPSTILLNLRRVALNSAQYITEDRAYFNGSQKKISPNEIYKRAQDYITSLLTTAGEKGSPVADWKDKIKPSIPFFQQHLDDVRGIKHDDVKLGEAAVQSLKEMYGEKYRAMPEFLRVANSFVYSSLLGLRSAFAIRDISNTHQNIFNRLGPEAAIKSLGGVVNYKFAQDLIRQGEIPVKSIEGILNPGENVLDGMQRLSTIITKTADKISNYATILNGQQLAHVQSAAGLWKYTWETVGDLSGKMARNEISKAKVYEKLHIEQLHPTDQRAFDALISAGKTDQAGRYLARQLVREFNVDYGMNNAPQNWKSWYGKLAGGFGQWTTNQIQTNANNFLRGTIRQRLGVAARTTISNGALWTAGAATGINLSQWMISPATIPGESPLLAGLLGLKQDLEGTSNLDPAIANPAGSKLLHMMPFYKQHGEWHENVAHLYLPFSYWVQSEIDAAEMIKGGFGPSGYAKMLTGVSTINDTVSPLQQWLNDRPEWKGKTVPDNGVGGSFLKDNLLNVRTGQ